MRKNFIIECLSGLLILLFTYTAISKLIDFENFKETFRFIPHLSKYNYTIAWVLPIIELIIAFLLFIPRLRIAGLFASLSILIVFTCYIGYLLIFKPHDLPCSCGGVIRQMTFRQHILFNLFFIIISMAGLLLCLNTKLLQQTGSKLKTWPKSKHSINNY